MHPILARVRHDLLKHALWCARDLRGIERPLGSDLRALRRSLLELPDAEGRPVTARVLLRGLRGELGAPAESPDVFDAFERAVGEAEDAARVLDPERPAVEDLAVALSAVLALEPAFAALAARFPS